MFAAELSWAELFFIFCREYDLMCKRKVARNRHDDIIRMPARERAKFIDETRRGFPSDFQEARITWGEKTDSGWFLKFVTCLKRSGTKGKCWIARSVGNNYDITPA